MASAQYDRDTAVRRSILLEAEEIINGQRREDYGSAYESFKQLADYWSVYLTRKTKVRIDLHPLDVVNMMELLKISRAQNGFHRDSYVDIAGYAGCAEKIMDEEANMFAKELNEPRRV